MNLPPVSDLFGRKGREVLLRQELAGSEGRLLAQQFRLLEMLDSLIGELEKEIVDWSQEDERIRIVKSVPGIGPILGSVIVLESSPISRFCRVEKYVSYAGLAPRTHSSGGKTYQGRMVQQCNRWLQWAYVEAAWVAVGCSPYFGTLYRRHRRRGKVANRAIVIVARRMCRIVYWLLKEGRYYEPRRLKAAIPAALVKN